MTAPDLRAAAAYPAAAALTVAVADNDRDMVARVLTGLDTEQLYALAVVLAAHVDPDRPFTHGGCPPTILHAVTTTARAFHLTPAELLANDRRRHVCDARAVACYVARAWGYSYPEIGSHLGKHHTTVMHACIRVGEDARLRRLANRLTAREEVSAA